MFVLVALAALSAGILYLSSHQHTTGALDIQGARALAAARAGDDWMVATIMAQESAGNPPYACATSNLGFAGFAVTVTCTRSSHDEEGNRIHVYNITSTASAGGSPGDLGFVERQVQVVAVTCRVGNDVGPPC